MKEEGFPVTFAAGPEEWLVVGVRLSLIGPEQAQRSRWRKLDGLCFGKLLEGARARWNQALSAVIVYDGTRAQRTVSYTVLYRSLLQRVTSVKRGNISAALVELCTATAGTRFTVSNIWDTYRTMHALQMLLEPRRRTDTVMHPHEKQQAVSVA